MAKYTYITFDPYYDVAQYNRFLISAFNNNVEYKVFCHVKPPHHFYIRIEEKDRPKFIDFDEINIPNQRFLISTWLPRTPAEEVIIRRKPGDKIKQFFDKTSNIILKQAYKEEYVLFFKFNVLGKVKNYSKLLPTTKFHLLGTKANYKIGVVFDKKAGAIIEQQDIILLENEGKYRSPGELEAEMNFAWKKDHKLENKTLESPYVLDGIFYQISRPIIIYS